MISTFFLYKFYNSAVVPDSEVKLEIPESKIKTEMKRTEPEPEIDDLDQYKRYKLEFWLCC